MMRKWRGVVIVWIGILPYFGIGSFHPRDADLLLIIFDSVLLLAATIYTVVIWVRDQAKGEAEKTYHLSAFREAFSFLHSMRGERKQEHQADRRPGHKQAPDSDRT